MIIRVDGQIVRRPGPAELFLDVAPDQLPDNL